VKREADGGGGSRSLVDDTKPGDTLEVSAPRNDFALAAAPSYVLIAGGIGITPILSMARHLVSTGGAPFRLYYLGRSPEVMAFRDVLSGSEFRGRVVMHCDGGDPDRTFDLWPVLERPKGAHVYCCGPRGLMQAVRDMTGHWSSAAVHFEDFGAGNAAQPEDTAFQVRLARTGTTVDVPVGCSILEALRGHGVDIASSCESGSCGTCEVRLLEGEADHRDLVLAEHEKSRLIMVCVSRARSAELVLDL
jgi:phthalate 4,5-dioxygenase reductase subunit